jgi:undecaprenyl phosphate N,N'-diacetylbacillosamine 1-phosphate transferase
MYGDVLKRAFDLIGSLLGLIMLSPLLVVVFVSLYLLGKQAIFWQLRTGKNGRIFRLYKFRTMNNNRDADGHLLPDSSRLTCFGRFLRNSSIDELPQLINIMKGEMSFIGPRPLLPEYLNIYSKMQTKRHNVKPGISGWAQVNGRNTLSWEEKFNLDIWYVDNMSFTLDLKIFYLSIISVIKKKGISKEGHATTEAFNGHN